MDRFLFGLCLVFAVTPNVYTENEIRIVTWNIESGGADIAAIADRVSGMEEIDIWGFSEVQNIDWMIKLETAAETGETDNFEFIPGSTGGTDRLAIVYNTDKFEMVKNFEIHWNDRPWFTSNMRPRSALVAKLKHIASDVDFFFVVNHLYRGRGVDPRRLDQATALRDWASEKSLPVIAVGDYNFDWDLDINETAQNYEKGFGNMTAWSVFTWVVPANLITTHDSRYNSILDFIFIANSEGKINATSEILVAYDEFSPRSEKSDHRPVLGIFRFRE
ncbi:MAG: endonuclease/exonuclease/phosphatase [Candidatus Hydrogenedentota bacterium]|nr:MAG: endonuclease/exonuclease/phosphatase [Candidatus Hydrogenedentota bacterium]